MLGNFTSQGYTMMANPSYWQPVPVKKVYFPDYTTNTAAQNALFAGQIDWTGNYIPGLQKNFIDKDPAHNVAYEGSELLQRPVPEPEDVARPPSCRSGRRSTWPSTGS